MLFELKAFVGQRPGGVGFGNQRGQGPQVDLLFDRVSEMHRSADALSMLDHTIRWVLADATRSVGSPRYAVFNCSEAQSAAMNGVRFGKQNNLKISAFKTWITWPQLIDEALAFIDGRPS